MDRRHRLLGFAPSFSSSTARIRYVPNQLRGGMISLSPVPANAAVLFILVQGGYYRNIGNAAILVLAALRVHVFTQAIGKTSISELAQAVVQD